MEEIHQQSEVNDSEESVEHPPDVSPAPEESSRYSRSMGIFAVGLVLLLVTGVIYEGSWREVFGSANLHNQPAAAASFLNPFDTVQLEARSAIVLDASGGNVLFAKNAGQQLPLASITKIMTAIVTAEVLSEDAIVTIPTEALAREGDHGLVAGERWNLQDLIDFALIESSNDAAEALALAAAPYVPARGETGVARTIAHMNAKARELGLTQTYFLDATGLDAGESMAGSYGSAEDIAHLFAYAIRSDHDVIAGTAQNRIVLTNADGRQYTIRNTNDALGAIPGLIAGKTGYTDLAGGNLAVAFDAGIGHPIVVVVLGSSRDGRFNDVQQLVTTTQSYLEASALAESGEF